MTSIDKSKDSLRKKFFNLRKEVSSEYMQDAQEGAAKFFIQNIDFDGQKIISGYYPTNFELSPLTLMEMLNSNNIQTSLPVINEKEAPLIFQKWNVGDKLKQSTIFNIKEPDGEPVTPNIIITPLLAFDKNGHRLGYGGGYYDRTFNELKSKSKNFISVGYAYSFQETDTLPIGDKDIPLDYIVTDEKVHKF